MNPFIATLLQAHSKKMRGITLIELMVTLTVLAILMSIAIPSFNSLIASSRLSTSTNELFTTLNLAKSEAIKTGKRVTVCPSTDGATCSTVASPINWANGWIAFIDTTRATLPVVDAGETPFQVGQEVNNQILIQSNSDDYASFGPDGASKQISGALLNTKIRVCSTSASLTDSRRARDISIYRSGRIEIITPASVVVSCPKPTTAE